MPGVIDMGVCPITQLAAGTIVPQRFVTFGGVHAAAGGNAAGVAAMPAVAGEHFTMDILGAVTVESGAAVAADTLVQADASARAITRTAGAILARTIDAATAAGQMIRVSLIPN